MAKKVVTSIVNKKKEIEKNIVEIPSPEVVNPFEDCGCINCKLGRTEDNQQIPLAILRNTFPEGYIDQEIKKKLPKEHQEGCNCMNCRQTRVEIHSGIITEYFRKIAGQVDLSDINWEYLK